MNEIEIIKDFPSCIEIDKEIILRNCLWGRSNPEYIEKKIEIQKHFMITIQDIPMHFLISAYTLYAKDNRKLYLSCCFNAIKDEFRRKEIFETPAHNELWLSL